MTLCALRSGLAATVVVAVAVSCTSLSERTGGGQQSDAAPTVPADEPQVSGGPNPIAGFLASARPGDSTYLTLPDSNQRVQVIAQRIYFAASGRYCRRYVLTSSNSPEAVIHGLACKDGRGEWEIEKLVVNPDDVSAPQRKQ